MDKLNNIQLICPVRGQLKVHKKSADGLTSTEEYHRIEAIRYLISKKSYPKDNFLIEPIIKKFGNGGRNSFRSDFAVLDLPVSELVSHEPDEILKHALLLCEVKRENNKKDFVKETQVKPMLDFAINQNTIGLYWDNIDRRVFWLDFNNNEKEIKEGPISMLPKYGNNIKIKPLTFNTISPTDSLIDAFSEIEDILHQASHAPESRYEIILQLLLAKIFDEHQFEARPDEPLDFQDFKSLGTPANAAKDKLVNLVKRAVDFYSNHLPKKVSKSLDINPEILLLICEKIAPIKITHSKRDVMQTFYMKFAKDLYKWDMAQYFTPTSVTDFLVEILNPKFGELVADPACGSADFLVAAFRILRAYNPGYADCVYGIDNSPNAIQVAVLNMLLNGDGKTQLRQDDSLENMSKYFEKYHVIACNPPFGSKIVEKRRHVLSQFKLAHDHYKKKNGEYGFKDNLLEQQETGILFLELCVNICKPNGRIAIILPNGYLGNKSLKYRVVREWILKNTKLAAIVSLPRFTFKSSGADVSASVLYLEKRETPLKSLKEIEDYRVAIEIVQNLGWEAGNKIAKPSYQRNEEDGSYIFDEEGNPVLLCDFKDIIRRISNSNASIDFPWLAEGRERIDSEDAWTIGVKTMVSDEDITLDPKPYCRKVVSLQTEIYNKEHFVLGDLVDIIPEKRNLDNSKVEISPEKKYKYIELDKMNQGDFSYTELRGWELPDRAKHLAQPSDIYIGAIWGSVSKWCFIPQDSDALIVTNGCIRCRMKLGKEEYLPDLLSYLNTESWAVQMRSLARGSDGLAEIAETDIIKILIPKLSKEARTQLEPYIQSMYLGKPTLRAIVSKMIIDNELSYTEPAKRPSHIVLV